MSLRVLYFSQYFPPEVGATQTRTYEMARYLVSQGHRVTVVTEVPNHPSGIVPPEYKGKLSERGKLDGIDVLRLWVWASPEKNFNSRMRFYLSYMSMAAIAGSLIHGKFDVVFATSPPLFTGVAGLWTSMVRRAPFVFEVRDLWPESAVALGELNSRKAVLAAELLEKLLYSRAAHIVAVTNGIRQSLIERGQPPDKVSLIQNGANTEQFSFDPTGRERVRRELGVGRRFHVMYAGIHGVAQGLEGVLDAAADLSARKDITFTFVGEGPRKATLKAKSEVLGLGNVRFCPEVPSSRMPALLSSADCTVVPLRDEPVFRGALPSKMFEAWACERPVILSVAGEAADVLADAGGGIAVAPENASMLAQAITQLADNPEEAALMGQRGRAHVFAHYSRREQARKLEKLLLSAAAL